MWALILNLDVYSQALRTCGRGPVPLRELGGASDGHHPLFKDRGVP